MARQLGKKMLSSKSMDQPLKEEGAEPNPQQTDGATNGEDNIKTTITSLITWLESSPRPIGTIPR